MTIETYSVPKEKHHKIPDQTAVLRYIQNLETNPHKKA